jgi:hypothetical protein
LLGDDLRPARRRPVREVAYLNHWGEPWEDAPDP